MGSWGVVGVSWPEAIAFCALVIIPFATLAFVAYLSFNEDKDK
jgi:hypothetical protein